MGTWVRLSELQTWCICEECPQQKEEKKCCHFYSEIENHLEEDQIMCITSHEGMAEIVKVKTLI